MYESLASDNTKCATDFQIVTNIILNGEQGHSELHQTSEQSKIGGWVIAQNCAVYAVRSEKKRILVMQQSAEKPLKLEKSKSYYCLYMLVALIAFWQYQSPSWCKLMLSIFSLLNYHAMSVYAGI